MSQKISKIYNFDIFYTSPNLDLSPSQILRKILNLIIPPMCILLKFNYAKFVVSNLCFSQVIKENL